MTETPAPNPRKHVRRLLSSAMPTADYGVFLLAPPLIATVGLLIVALASHSWAGFFWLLALTAFVTALLAVMEIFQSPDAWESGSPLRPLGRWGAAVALLWPAGYPLYLRERRRYKLGNWFVAALIIEAVFLAGAGGALAITLTGYGTPPPSAEADKEPTPLVGDPHWAPEPDDIEVVKTGHLDNCPGKDLDQEVKGFFESPRWEAGATSDGSDFVNVHGILTYQGKPAQALLQFLMDKDRTGFRPYIFTIDGVPQPLYVTAFTLAQMCE